MGIDLPELTVPYPIPVAQLVDPQRPLYAAVSVSRI
jgi:hypothetical protein